MLLETQAVHWAHHPPLRLGLWPPQPAPALRQPLRLRFQVRAALLGTPAAQERLQGRARPHNFPVVPPSALTWRCQPSPSFVNLALLQSPGEAVSRRPGLSPAAASCPSGFCSGSRGSHRGVGAGLSPLCGRLKDCSEKTNSDNSRDVGPTCSRDEGSTCFNIIQSPCFELIPEEECVERFWYGW